MDIKEYFLHPGYIFVTAEPYIMETVLGSCITVCLWDRIKKIGGMNHYIYPECKRKEDRTARYGNISIPYMIKMMIEKGADIDNVIAYSAGGARNIHLSSFVGDNNIRVAREVLMKRNIKLVKTDFGGIKGRKVRFNNVTGEFKIEIINGNDNGRCLL